MTGSQELHLDGYEDYHPLRLAGAGRFWDRNGQKVRRPFLGRNKKGTIRNIQIVDKHVQHRNSILSTAVTTSHRNTPTHAEHMPEHIRMQTVTLQVYDDAGDLCRAHSLEAPRTSVPFGSRPFSPVVQRPRARSACQDELFLPETPSFKSWQFPRSRIGINSAANASERMQPETLHNVKDDCRIHSSASSRSPSTSDVQQLSMKSNTKNSSSLKTVPSLSNSQSLFSDIDSLVAKKSSTYCRNEGSRSMSPGISGLSPSPSCAPSVSLVSGHSSKTAMGPSPTISYLAEPSAICSGVELDPGNIPSKEGPGYAGRLLDAVDVPTQTTSPLLPPQLPKVLNSSTEHIGTLTLAIPDSAWSNAIADSRSSLLDNHGESRFNTLPGEPFPYIETAKATASSPQPIDVIQIDERKADISATLTPDRDLLPWFVHYAGGKGVYICSG